MNSIPQDQSKHLPKKKGDSSLDNLRLTPSEIKSLRKHKQQVSLQARGKFKHLFQEK